MERSIGKPMGRMAGALGRQWEANGSPGVGHWENIFSTMPHSGLPMCYPLDLSISRSLDLSISISISLQAPICVHWGCQQMFMFGASEGEDRGPGDQNHKSIHIGSLIVALIPVLSCSPPSISGPKAGRVRPACKYDLQTQLSFDSKL